MYSEDLVFKVFDAWQLSKSSDSVAKIAKILDNKLVEDITFTCCHPSHAGELTTHTLGSSDGNLHFTLGYCNPGFHMAPYHLALLDPDMTEDQLKVLSKTFEHPSNPAIWKKYGSNVGAEGDLKDGIPHALFTKLKKVRDKERKLATEGAPFSVDGSSYRAFKEQGVIYDEKNKALYPMDTFTYSYLSSQAPAVFKAEVKADAPTIQKSFDDDVFPLVKSVFPAPGSVFPMTANTDETVYGHVGSRSIQFLDREGFEVGVEVFDCTYKSIDLVPGGNTAPFVLVAMAKSVFGADLQDYEGFIAHKGLETDVGTTEQPTPGFDNTPEDLSNLNKHVDFENGAWVLKVTP